MPETPARLQSPPERRRPEAEEIELTVVYEDDSLIAIDKPPGMVVHPTYKNWSGTLLNALLWRVRGREAVIPSIITRLDKQTSGLVLVALSPAIHAKVQRDAEVGLVRKEYLALVEGVPLPDAGTIALPLARSAEDRRRVVVIDSGQASETRYEVLSTTGAQSVVRCELVTGRKPGRTDSTEIAVFDSTGTAVQDAVSAIRIYQQVIDQSHHLQDLPLHDRAQLFRLCPRTGD